MGNTDLDARLADWEARLDRLEAGATRRPRLEAVNGGDHVLFVPSPTGYELLERAGAAPFPGEPVELEGQEGRYAVSRLARSPVPGDERTFVYLAAI